MSKDARDRMLGALRAQFGPGQVDARLRIARQWGDALASAVREGAWHLVVRRQGEVAKDDPLHSFIAAAKDMQSADAGTIKRRRQRLKDAQAHIAAIRIPYSYNPYYHHAVEWSRVIEAKLEALQAEMARSREIPAVFVVGTPLDPHNPDEREMFRTRRDFYEYDADAREMFRTRRDFYHAAIIDHDLDDDRCGTLLLTGQRRMGKTSLLRMLQLHLGRTTIVVPCNFQRLSGSDFPSAPHRLVVEIVSTTLVARNIADLPIPDTASVTDAWGTALRWLLTLDKSLADHDHRILITIDEIEALQRGVEEGWSNLTFLDFVRAAGDSLHRIRFLLVSAHPLSSPRLGPKWSDRLISVLPRQLGPLSPEDAEQLLRKPVDYFPDGVFDDDAVAHILAQTGTHPFLIQAVGNEVVKRLNAEHRHAATAKDVERALDAAVSVVEEQLFADLWNSFDADAATLMSTLARGGTVDPHTPTFRALRTQFFVDLRDNEPVFTFPLFGRWIRDYRS
jgi:hypothetical protein